MDANIALFILIAAVGALTLSSWLYQRQQAELARRLQITKLSRTVRELDEGLALLDALGSSLVLREAFHGMRQALVQRLANMDPKQGWATRLGDEAPDSPGSAAGPFVLANLNAVPPVQLRLAAMRDALATATQDPDLLIEINELIALVQLDTLLSDTVNMITASKQHEQCRANLSKARTLLRSPMLSTPTKANRGQQVNDIGMGMAKQARIELEASLSGGDSIEQAFIDMLNQPPASL
ncbi:hypothetical protein GH975_07285 [Litorivicinus lipolyticus]|uniref:Uncharacterized protein n=1 Tax=Litorivicinus lipolyticus TaxID=418701 RepID=A0A5Q2QDH2_9GAMM|nr:hypothetical protein [Litorivicinus lipolyticus]QGG80382.1 hypothetical protein GH975_07285 [Litorivicinus lipolyticus]